jgi:hypothetical protein
VSRTTNRYRPRSGYARLAQAVLTVAADDARFPGLRISKAESHSGLRGDAQARAKEARKFLTEKSLMLEHWCSLVDRDVDQLLKEMRRRSGR